MELEPNEPPESLSVGFCMLQTGYALISAYEQRICPYNSIITIKEEWPRSQRISLGFNCLSFYSLFFHYLSVLLRLFSSKGDGDPPQPTVTTGSGAP